MSMITKPSAGRTWEVRVDETPTDRFQHYLSVGLTLSSVRRRLSTYLNLRLGGVGRSGRLGVGVGLTSEVAVGVGGRAG